MKVKEITVDVGTGQEIAGREGIAWESCINKVLLFSLLYGLGTKLQDLSLTQALPVAQLVLGGYVEVSVTCIVNGINVSFPLSFAFICLDFESALV